MKPFARRATPRPMRPKPQMPIVFPIEIVLHHDALGNSPCVIAIVALEVRIGIIRRLLVSEHFFAPIDVPGNCLGIRIDQQLVRVEPMAIGRVVRAVNAVAVELLGPRVRQIGVGGGPAGMMAGFLA